MSKTDLFSPQRTERSDVIGLKKKKKPKKIRLKVVKVQLREISLHPTGINNNKLLILHY